MKHAKYSPSMFPIWAECGNYEPDNSDSEKEEMSRGTLLHSAISEVLSGKSKPQGICFDDSIKIDKFINFIKSFEYEYTYSEKMIGEDNDFFGTADILLKDHFGPDIIIDFKTGIYLDYSKQLAAYKFLLGSECRTIVYNCDLETVYEYNITIDECGYICNQIMNKRDDRELPKSTIEYCSWCGNKKTCPVFCRDLNNINIVRELCKDSKNIVNLSNDEIQETYLILNNLVDGILELIKQEIKERMISGEKFSRIKLCEKLSPRKVDAKKFIEEFSNEYIIKNATISMEKAIEYASEEKKISKKDAEKYLTENKIINDLSTVIKYIRIIK